MIFPVLKGKTMFFSKKHSCTFSLSSKYDIFSEKMRDGLSENT